MQGPFTGIVSSGRGPLMIFRCRPQRTEGKFLPFAHDFTVPILCLLYHHTTEHVLTKLTHSKEISLGRLYYTNMYTVYQSFRNNANTPASQWQKSFHLWSVPQTINGLIYFWRVISQSQRRISRFSLFLWACNRWATAFSHGLHLVWKKKENREWPYSCSSQVNGFIF